jgi:hypothetical protein
MSDIEKELARVREIPAQLKEIGDRLLEAADHELRPRVAANPDQGAASGLTVGEVNDLADRLERLGQALHALAEKVTD